MGTKRPSTKIPFWNPRFENRPDVEPPAPLRVIAALSVVSIVGTSLFSVLSALSGVGVSELASVSAAYIAWLHFLIPFLIAYTISTNSHLSRIFISVYVVVLCGATISGKGYLGNLFIDAALRLILSIAVMASVIGWLFWSPKARYYYALITNKPVPEDLAGRNHVLDGKNWIGGRTKATIAWITNHLETVVLVGFILVALYAFLSTA